VTEAIGETLSKIMKLFLHFI